MRPKIKKTIFCIIIIAIGVFYIRKTESTEHSDPKLQSTPLSVPQTNPITQTLTSPPSKMFTTIPVKSSVTEAMPELSQYRTEAKQNPHSTPPTFLNFADFVSSRMQESNGDKPKAMKFFDELKHCVLNDDQEKKIPAVQAFCADVAKILAEKNELNDQWYDLYNKLPENLRPLLAPVP